MSSPTIVDYANQNGLTLKRHSCGLSNLTHHCARSVIRHSINPNISPYDNRVNEAVGMTMKEMDSLESGFDYGDQERDRRTAPSLKYFTIGQEIARLAGLAS